MRSRIASIFILWGGIFGLESLQATDYYVAKSGSNSNNGSAGAPWLTIQKAADTMRAGDRVMVSPGTYNEQVVTRAHGTASQLIRFMTTGTEPVVMRGFDIDHDYIHVKGFDITGSGPSTYQGYIDISETSDYCLITENRIHHGINQIFGIRIRDGSKSCTFSKNVLEYLDWIYIDINGSYHLVEGNRLSNCPGWDAIRLFGHHHTVRNNWFEAINKTGSNHTDLFQTFGVNGDVCYDIVVEGNHAVNCDSQIGNFEDNGQQIRDLTFRNNVFVNVTSSANIFCEYTYWYNNTFYNCSTRNNNCVLYFSTQPDKGTANNGICMNNVFVGCGGTNDYQSGWYTISPGVNNFSGDYNFVARMNWLPKQGFNEPHGINGGDPRFVDLSGGDLRIKKDSPVVGKGCSISGFTNDKDGNVRSQLWDMGAYEYLPKTPENVGIEYLN
ncbi:MAG: DUF1565 domain-containing protein [Planctomycetes bacterium]|nr:DUF1565 domain-containing protein [Planctomycetota bacterium]